MAGTLTVDTLKASSGVLATQNGMSGVCKAWAQYSVASGGPLTINGSFNVSSITRIALGTVQVAFTTNMPNINYAVSGGVSAATSTGTYGGVFSPYTNVNAGAPYYAAPTTSGFYACTAYNPASSTLSDNAYVGFAVFSF